MAKPLIVEIPHEIGPVEAKRRISSGLDKAKAACAKAGINVEHMTWTDDRLNFAMSAMGQKVDGEVDVLPETVRIEVRLPMLLAPVRRADEEDHRQGRQPAPDQEGLRSAIGERQRALARFQPSPRNFASRWRRPCRIQAR